MFSSLKYKIFFPCLILASLLLMSAPMVLADASGVKNTLDNLDNTATKGYGALPTPEQSSLPAIIGKVVGAALALVGSVFFILILWAGFEWMTAKGDEEKITKAKETIFAATLGLIVILGAYAITRLIAQIFNNALTGT